MTKEQLIKEFREKFYPTYKKSFKENDAIEMPIEYADWVYALKDIEAFLLSAFDAGRASGIEEVNKKIKDKKEMYEPAYEPEDQAIVSVLSELLTPSSSKDN